MHSFLIDMCRSCLATNGNLKEYVVVKDKEIKCFDAVKMIFPNSAVPEYCGHGYSLCEACINLLKSTVIFQGRLSESHNAYNKYMEALNFPKCYKFFVVPVQINKGYLPMLKVEEDSRLKLTENTDFDNSLSELGTMIDKKDNISLRTSQEECKNLDSVEKEITIADNDNCNQMDFLTAENVLSLKNIKEEVDNDIPMADNVSCYQLDSKIEIKEEHIASCESTKNGHEHFESVYDCEEQGKHEILADSSTDLKQEKTTTINSEECEASPIVLIKHKVNHKRKRPHKCDVCDKNFSTNSKLIRHNRVHTEERHYKCDVWEKSFFQSSHLIKHKRIHTGERPYKCDVCEKSFTCNSTLIEHKRVHTGERPYKCDVCEKGFTCYSNLIKHKRVHTGERPYKCDVCGKKFSANSTFIKHKRIHTGKQP